MPARLQDLVLGIGNCLGIGNPRSETHLVNIVFELCDLKNLYRSFAKALIITKTPCREIEPVHPEVIRAVSRGHGFPGTSVGRGIVFRIIGFGGIKEAEIKVVGNRPTEDVRSRTDPADASSGDGLRGTGPVEFPHPDLAGCWPDQPRYKRRKIAFPGSRGPNDRHMRIEWNREADTADSVGVLFISVTHVLYFEVA